MPRARKSRVVLVNPLDTTVLSDYFAPCENLAIAYLGGYVREKGHEVLLIDGDAERIPQDDLVAKALAFEPDVVGITCLARTIDAGLETAEAIKLERPETHVCMGGQHATYAAADLLAESVALDSVVRGEGEETFGELLERLEAGASLEGLRGCYARGANGTVLKNPDRVAIRDLDALPYPARDTLERLIEMGRQPVIAMLSSRGCFSRCTFCNATHYFKLGGGKTWRGRSPRDVVDELELLVKKYGTTSVDPVVHFYDDEFVGPGRIGQRRTRALAEELIQRDLGVEFYMFCRADSIVPGNEDLVALLKRAGLVRAFIGIESSQPSELALFKKGTTPDQNVAVVKLLDDLGISMPASGFIMFQPYSTYETLRANAEFLKRIGLHSFYNLSVKLIVYEGNGIVPMLERDGLLGAKTAHGGCYEYSFQDPGIGIAADALDLSGDPVLMKADAVGRYIQATKYAIRDRLPADEYEQAGFEEVDQSIQSIFDFGHEFFDDVLDLAAEGWSEGKYLDLKAAFLRGMDEQIADLEGLFRRCLEATSVAVDRACRDSVGC